MLSPAHRQVLAATPRRRAKPGSDHAGIGLLAVRSLYRELALYPKPGLVSLVDSGSHADMDASTFVRSLFSLRRYFIAIAQAGAHAAPFEELKRLGIEAETRMLVATGGINTHRGAIFSLGLLSAAAGHCVQHGTPVTDAALRSTLLEQWGVALREHAQAEAGSWSNGRRASARYGVGGARMEAALGLPALFELALPQLRRRLDAGARHEHALVDVLFALMQAMEDTNIYHRRGAAGAELVRRQAAHFLAHGGTAASGWQARALDTHRLFIRHRLSPGGAADLLAATCFVDSLTRSR